MMGYREVRTLMEGHARRSPQCKPLTASVPSSEVLGAAGPAGGRCLQCGVPLDAAEAVRVQLHDLAGSRRGAEGQRERAMATTLGLVREGRRLGMGPTELERLTGLTRRTIYDLIKMPVCRWCHQPLRLVGGLAGADVEPVRWASKEHGADCPAEGQTTHEPEERIDE